MGPMYQPDVLKVPDPHLELVLYTFLFLLSFRYIKSYPRLQGLVRCPPPNLCPVLLLVFEEVRHEDVTVEFGGDDAREQDAIKD